MVWILLREHNEQRPHSRKYCFGETPMQTFIGSMTLAKEKRVKGKGPGG
jgi:hypothetical protein